MSKPLRVLIVEDLEKDAMLVVRELQSSGYEVAFERVETHDAMAAALESQTWDIIIADYVLPSFSGPDALMLLKESGLDVPFILISSRIGEGIAAITMEAGAHDFVLKDNLARLGPAIARELREVIERRERRRAQEEVVHLNAVLRAIRTVNRLIVQEDDRDRLLRAVCQALTSTRGYNSVWIALFDEDGSLVEAFESELGDSFTALCEVLQRGELPQCMRDVLANPEVTVTKHTATTCADCPLAEVHSGAAGLAMRLEHAGKVYGLVSASLPADVADSEDEQSLFAAVTADIAFGLSGLEVEAERRQAEQQLREREADQAALIQSLPYKVFRKDQDSVYVFCNEAFAADLGITPDQLPGKTDYDLFPKELADKYRADDKRLMASGETETIEEIYIEGGQGRVVQTVKTPVRDQDGKIIGIIGIFWDITEQKEAEEALQREYERTQTILASSMDGFFTVGLNAAIRDCNEAFCEMLGYSRNELLSLNIADVEAMESREDTAERIEQVRQTGGDRFETVHRRKDGTIIYVDISTTFVELPTESIFVCFARDITERKQAEAEVKEANLLLQKALSELREVERQMVQQERLHALGQMASGIAHDFNNALTPILLFSDSLLAHPDSLEDRERVADALQQIKASAEDAVSVVRRLREFYRLRDEQDELQVMDFNQVIAEVISLTEPMWKEQATAASTHITLEADLQPLPAFVGSESELREALTNLMLNAVDAVPDGGAITIRSRAYDDTIVLEVRDTGVGMTPDVRQRCLEPFFTTKDERGTGIGLAMVYGTVERHHGTIEIESEAGEGTTVRIRLPVRVMQAQEGEAEMADAVASPLDILLVEDEESVLEALRQDLTAEGHRVEVASNGREGLEKFQAASFDLVITDRAMPEMSGDELAAAIKEVAPDMPIILLTGFGDMMEVTGDKPAGVDLILSKPVTVAALRDAVAKVMAE